MDMNDEGLYEPVDARPLESGAIQKIYRFANGYGASVVKGEHTYGGDEGLWELAVITFALKADNHTYTLCYDTPITQDVEGNLNDGEVEEMLDKIIKNHYYENTDEIEVLKKVST